MDSTKDLDMVLQLRFCFKMYILLIYESMLHKLRLRKESLSLEDDDIIYHNSLPFTSNSDLSPNECMAIAIVVLE